MIMEEMKKDLKKVRAACQEFYDQYSDEYIEFLRDENADAEKCLQQELLFQLLDHIQGICHLTDYLDRKIVKEGSLSRSESDEILLDGEKLPLMKEIEVYVYDENCGHEVWTVTYVCGAGRLYLMGFDKEMDLNEIPARVRE